MHQFVLRSAICYAALLGGCLSRPAPIAIPTEIGSVAKPSAPDPLWPSGRVPYVIHTSFQSDSLHIREVMKSWEDGTPVRFTPRTASDSRYLLIREGNCVTTTGRNPVIVSADPECIGHELGHALGLAHEHQRPDRDDYVTIRTPWWWL